MDANKIVEELGYGKINEVTKSSYIPTADMPPQFATIDTLSGCWSITSGNKRESGFGEFPRELNCPIIDRSAMTQTRVNKIHRKFGIVIADEDIPKLIAQYVKYGGKIIE